MSGLVGYRVTNHATGQHGIVVSARQGSAWRGAGAAYDVIWDDRSCSLKVSMEKMAAEGWKLGERKVSLEECNRIWCDYQVERARRLEQEHVRVARRHPIPISVSRQDRVREQQSANIVRMDQRRDRVHVPEMPIEEVAKPASWHARRILAQAMPGVSFALSVDRKKLSVGWIDGPVQQRVEQVLQGLIVEGRVERIAARRGVNETFVQAAIALVLDRIWGEDESAPALSDRMRICASDYLAGSMPPIMTPMSSPVGAVPYAHLIRCLMEGWDFEQVRFIEVERTRYLRQEVSFLFPNGLLAASEEFQGFLASSHDHVQSSLDVLSSVPHLDRARG